jgi:hypothetical protein
LKDSTLCRRRCDVYPRRQEFSRNRRRVPLGRERRQVAQGRHQSYQGQDPSQTSTKASLLHHLKRRYPSQRSSYHAKPPFVGPGLRSMKSLYGLH